MHDDQGIEEAMAANVKASRDLMHAVTNEVALVESWIEDFADSELEMKGVSELMDRCIPETGVLRGEKRTKVVSSPESLIAMTKATELFILDMALKSFQSKALEPSEEKRISNKINLNDLRMAVRNQENLDFLEMVVDPLPLPQPKAMPVAVSPPAAAKSSSSSGKSGKSSSDRKRKAY